MVQALEAGDSRNVGKYRLLGRIGRGGMGQVFLGQSPGGRMVAVKLIRADLAGDPEFRARFAREVATARTVSGIFTVRWWMPMWTGRSRGWLPPSWMALRLLMRWPARARCRLAPR